MQPSAQGALSRGAVLVLLALLGLIGVGASTPSAADDHVPWSVRTAANSFGADRPNYTYTLNPGGELEDGVEVVNHGTTPLDLAVYGADAFTTDDGRLDLATSDATSTGVGAWVHPARDHVRLRAGESVVVPFTLSVPPNAEPGDHMGGIVTALTQADAAAGIDVDRRLAIRIRLRVSGALKPSLSVEDLNLHYSGTARPFGQGDATVTYTIHNTGNTILAARQSTSVADPTGHWRVSAEYVDDSPQLLPGETWKVSVPVRGVTPALRVNAKVTLVPLLTDSAGSISPLSDVEATTHAWTIPWALLLVVVLGGLVLVIVAVGRRRRRTQV